MHESQYEIYGLSGRDPIGFLSLDACGLHEAAAGAVRQRRDPNQFIVSRLIANAWTTPEHAPFIAVHGVRSIGPDGIDAIDQDRGEIEFGARVHDTELQPERRGPQPEAPHAGTEADIDTLVKIVRSTGTAGDDESVCGQHGQRCHGMLLYFCGEP
jgi:hypothetical protein